MRFFYVFCFLIAFTSCKQKEQHLTKITAKTIAVDSTFQGNTAINEAVLPYKKQLVEDLGKLNFTLGTLKAA